MMLRFLVTVTLCFAVSTTWGVEQDYEKVCSYFVELKKAEKNKKFNKIQRKEFITERIEMNLSVDSPARQAWPLVLYGVPEVRYELYTDTAEDVMRKKWHCNAMKELIPVTGDD